MVEPVLVIHGVNVRDQVQFNKDVAKLNELVGDEWELHPVFWGSDAAKVDYIDRVVPHIGLQVRSEDDFAAWGPLAASLLAGTIHEADVRSEDARGDIVADAAAKDAGVRGDVDASEIRDAIRAEWKGQQWLQLVQDEEALREVGRAVADALAEEQQGGIDVRSADRIRGAVRGVLRAINRATGALVSLTAGNFHQYLRRSLAPHIGRFLGDIFVYESRRDALQGHLREAVARLGGDWGRPARPVSVLAHSLGGLITFDAAVRPNDPLYVRNLLTFGSQPAFFHVVNRRYRLDAFAGDRIRLGATIRRWLNVWQPLDPLAFLAARVFEIEGGTFPKDVMLPHLGSDPLWTHSVYWTSEVFAGEVRNFLRGA